ncbi:NADP-dependent oxidoreductase [Streptomyces albidoflavus]|uniref:Alcohol dehydrogenase n=1 Tax=Streptomyces wadayamensis TaxID=141454 RepID=A0ABR4SDS1_9ACTN|nr:MULTISPECIES: NADP-dependent oxidoreductase [Streptomyces]BDH54244.1 NADPH:quinone reductase [Streptomyces albus]AGI91452.1 Oxidoreductase [Streptomyces albidoflavus]EFE80369.1 oxidoreductase [Streptomyces albidoflavus]KDR63355.1 alcohol dehydrogenase [Streptomyces wadayamensis]MCO6698450.1 NADP-dependent oxidoreductase [Streptomyces sp. Vc17.3-30]
MQGISYRTFGGPEVLEYGDLPDPKLAPDAVLVKVVATAVNPVDLACRSGLLAPLLDTAFPVIPGWDVSGVVVQRGWSVDEYTVGDEVIGYARKDWLSQGTCAEYVACPVRTLAHKPRNLGFLAASGLPLAGLTALQALRRWLEVRRGETLLVHGAAGAVGSMAVRIGVDLGARVVGASRADAAEQVRALGAEPVAYEDGFGAAVRELVPEGVDAALDTVGGPVLAGTPPLLAQDGRLASVADGEVLSLGGVYVFVRPDPHDLADLAGLAEAGAVGVTVARSFPLDRADDAHRAAAQYPGSQGKTVITVDWE